MKKRIISLCMVVCLLAVAIVGGTMAYFTDETEVATNVMTVGEVKITQTEEVDATTPLVPTADDVAGMKLDNKIVTVKNEGDVPVYVRTLIAFEDTNSISNLTHFEVNKELDDGNQYWVDDVTIDGIQYDVYVMEYPEALVAGAEMESLIGFWIDDQAGNTWRASLGDNDKYDILVMSQAVQSDGWATGTTFGQALNKAFGTPDTTNVAEWFASNTPAEP